VRPATRPECGHYADHSWPLPEDNDQEFFVTAWCFHPRFIPEEQIIFIPEPQILGAVEASCSELPGLRYLVRLRLVAYQDWNTQPSSPADDGQGNDGDVGNGGADAGHEAPPRGEMPEEEFFGRRQQSQQIPSGD
jgi:hypothetical protein